MKSKVIAFIILFLMQIACYSLIFASSSKTTSKNFRKHKLNKLDCSIYLTPKDCGGLKDCFWDILHKKCENLDNGVNKHNHNSSSKIIEDANKLVSKLEIHHHTHTTLIQPNPHQFLNPQPQQLIQPNHNYNKINGQANKFNKIHKKNLLKYIFKFTGDIDDIHKVSNKLLSKQYKENRFELMIEKLEKDKGLLESYIKKYNLNSFSLTSCENLVNINIVEELVKFEESLRFDFINEVAGDFDFCLGNIMYIANDYNKALDYYVKSFHFKKIK